MSERYGQTGEESWEGAATLVNEGDKKSRRGREHYFQCSGSLTQLTISLSLC